MNTTLSNTNQFYDLYFSGQFLNITLAQAQANLAQLFKTDIVKINHFFDGKNHLLKEKLNHQDALNYLEYFNKLGLILEMHPNGFHSNAQHLDTTKKAENFATQKAPQTLSEEKFNLYFEGKFSTTLTLDTACEAFAKLFNCSIQHANNFFNGQKHLIKSNLSNTESAQYIQAFEKLGLVTHRETVTTAKQPQNTASQQSNFHTNINNQTTQHTSAATLLTPSNNDHIDTLSLDNSNYGTINSKAVNPTFNNINPLNSKKPSGSTLLTASHNQIDSLSLDHSNYGAIEPQAQPINTQKAGTSTIVTHNSNHSIDSLSLDTPKQPEANPKAKYSLVFSGQHENNLLPLSARENFAQLFKCNIAQTASYFDGRPHTLKKDLSLTEVNQYIDLFKTHGLIAKAETVKPNSMSLFGESDPFVKEEIILLEDEDESITRFEDIEWMEHKGRVNRDLYCLLSLVPVILYVIAEYIPGFVGGLIAKIAFWMSISITVRRFHDLNLSGWFVLGLIALWFITVIESFSMPFLIVLIPIFSLVFAFIPGTKEENRFGPPINLDPTLKMAIYPFIALSLFNIYSTYNTSNEISKIVAAAKQEARKMETWLAEHPSKTAEDYFKEINANNHEAYDDNSSEGEGEDESESGQ